jgi:hypothetical protein
VKEIKRLKSDKCIYIIFILKLLIQNIQFNKTVNNITDL